MTSTNQPLDYAAIQAEHRGHSASALRLGGCSVNAGGRETPGDRCSTYRLAVDAERLADKVARARGAHAIWHATAQGERALHAALADQPEQDDNDWMADDV